MKKWIPALFLIVVLPVWSQSDALGAIGYVVQDIERSEAFYTEIIGMQPAGSFSLDSIWSREAGAAGQKPFSVRMFRLGSDPDATVLKLAYFDQTAPRPPQNGIHTPAGINYLTLNYSSLQEVVHRVKKAGIPILGYVRREGYQLLFIRDPDGLFIELVGPPNPPVDLD